MSSPTNPRLNIQENKIFLEITLRNLQRYVNSDLRSELTSPYEFIEVLFREYKKFCYAVMYEVYADRLEIEEFDKRDVEDFRVSGMALSGDVIRLDESQLSKYLDIAERSQGLLPIGEEFNMCIDICDEEVMKETFFRVFK